MRADVVHLNDSDAVLFTRAGLEIGVAATKTFVAQVAAMYLVALRLAELRGEEPEPEKGGRWKKLLVLTGLIALAGFAAAKLKGKRDDNWQSSYQPSTAPGASTAGVGTAGAATGAGVGAAGTGAVITDDTAGSDPAESLSDQRETPHTATTPDQPVEVVEVEEIDETRGDDRL